MNHLVRTWVFSHLNHYYVTHKQVLYAFFKLKCDTTASGCWLHILKIATGQKWDHSWPLWLHCNMCVCHSKHKLVSHLTSQWSVCVYECAVCYMSHTHTHAHNIYIYIFFHRWIIEAKQKAATPIALQLQCHWCLCDRKMSSCPCSKDRIFK